MVSCPITRSGTVPAPRSRQFVGFMFARPSLLCLFVVLVAADFVKMREQSCVCVAVFARSAALVCDDDRLPDSVSFLGFFFLLSLFFYG